jgi:CPA2 family monovalent cation:H+ antiporter-2
MEHLPALIYDLALILGSAAVIILLFKRLKQPVVLGYIIAGILVSPNFHLFPTVTDVANVRIWADIGVIFLLFALGLEFSFKKLVKVGGAAAITGVTELFFMLLLGYSAGQLLGWKHMDSLFLGGIIAISSTTIIFRAFDELDLRSKQFTRLVMGVLIIEDLVAVLLMVLLSTLAVSRELAGGPMMMAVLKLGFFLSLWFLMGIFLLPTVFKFVGRWMNSETLLIFALALCFGMVLLAEGVGFSSALGAFIMGSILAETLHSERIEKLIKPIKNLFGAIFFVSVGMLIDGKLLLQYIVPVCVITFLVIFGKTFFVTVGAIISGRPLKQALQAGTSMSQIGEFSFIIATLGISLNVTSSYLYPIAVGVSVITVFATPYMIRLAVPLNDFLQRTLPEKWLRNMNSYSAASDNLRGESDWKKFLKAFVQLLFVNGIIIVALLLLSVHFVNPYLEKQFSNNFTARLVTAIITLIIMMPFVWGLTGRRIHSSAYRALWLDAKYNRGPLVVVEILRNAVAIVLVGVFLLEMFNWYWALSGTVLMMIIVTVLFRKKLQTFYSRIEQRFIQNLNEKESSTRQDHLSPWDAHLSSYEIDPSVPYIGQTLEELAWREKFGINIAFIERGNKIIIAPKKGEQIFPYDNVGVIGTDQQLQEFASILHSKADGHSVGDDKTHVRLQAIRVDEHTKLKNKSIRESGLTEMGLVVGIERNGERVLNPSSNEKLLWDDLIWIVGDRRKINQLFVR